MKYLKLIISFLIATSIYGNCPAKDHQIDEYLKNYFKSSIYVIWKDTLELDARSLIIAVSYIDEQKSIIRKAVALEQKEDEIIAHVFFVSVNLTPSSQAFKVMS